MRLTDTPQGFLLAQFVLTGFPLVLVGAFTITVFIFTLIVALALGLIAAVLLSASCIGVSLILIPPILCFTSFAASVVFLWGLCGYYVIRYFNDRGKARANPGHGSTTRNITAGDSNGDMQIGKENDEKALVERNDSVLGGLGNQAESALQGTLKSNGIDYATTSKTRESDGATTPETKVEDWAITPNTSPKVSKDATPTASAIADTKPSD